MIHHLKHLLRFPTDAEVHSFILHANHAEILAIYGTVIFLFFMTVGLVVNLSVLVLGIRKSFNPIAMFFTGLGFFLLLWVTKKSYNYIKGDE